MFKEIISKTPLTSYEADLFFKNITGDSFLNDTSFLATLRALVYPRIGKDDCIVLEFSKSSYNKESLDYHGVSAVINAMMASHVVSDQLKNSIIIHSLGANKEGNAAVMKALEEEFSNVFKGFSRVEKVREFFRKSFNVDCYINPEIKSVIVFVENLDVRRLHYLQISILAFFPWYFDPEKGVSDEELSLIYSLREKTSEKYMNCLLNISKKYDFRSEMIKNLLSGFENRFEKAERDRVKNSILDTNYQIQRLNDEISRILSKKNELCIKLLGLEQKIAEGKEASELVNYFLCNKRLSLESVNNSIIRFVVRDYLGYFDSDMAERMIKNRNSFVYLYGDASDGLYGIEACDMERLLSEIFVEDSPRLKIRVCAAYSLNASGTISPISGYFTPETLMGHIPNPHINEYACMGDYSRTISSFMVDRDYINAIEQCVASCKSLNWSDSTVMERFMDILWNPNARASCCIELPNGAVVRPAQAIGWLKECDAKEEAGAVENEPDKEADNENDVREEPNE